MLFHTLGFMAGKKLCSAALNCKSEIVKVTGLKPHIDSHDTEQSNINTSK